ncbi:response regulator transcription factor [Shumkonia mesophila]|uniref:response regulator transcription factor n=1 Tax=Shumkonia mesophila TaxID=2838854 RepID=UPI0029348A02|nr:response regulator transcription factor [Shumkonia mesophila]
MSDEAKSRILVVDDESHIRKFLRISLTAHGYAVVEAVRGADAIQCAASEGVDLVVLDLGLPDMDGQDVIRRLREWTQIPILVLSVRADEMDKVEALDAGANDYVTKPFGIAELIARVRVLLRNGPEGGTAEDAVEFSANGLVIDFAGRQVSVDGVGVRLTRKEFDLLRLLARNAGKVLTYPHLLREVWGETYVLQNHYLRVHIGHLRQKLGDDPNDPRFIWTEAGVGYRFIGEG